MKTNEPIRVTDAGTMQPEERRLREIRQLRALLESRLHRIDVGVRYLRRFGDRKPSDALQLLYSHLRRAADSAEEIRLRIERIERSPQPGSVPAAESPAPGGTERASAPCPAPAFACAVCGDEPLETAAL